MNTKRLSLIVPHIALVGAEFSVKMAALLKCQKGGMKLLQINTVPAVMNMRIDDVVSGSILNNDFCVCVCCVVNWQSNV